MYDPVEEITLQVDSASITAKKRKLKAVWSYEAAQDIQSMHNLDAQQQLADIMAKEIAAEIDREILNDMANNQGSAVNWIPGAPWNGAHPTPQEEPAWGFKKKKKAPKFRDITEPWEPSMG